MEPNAPDPLIGLELHGFIVTHALRAGGMGLVYEARHPLIGHRVAVKVLRPEYSGNSEVSARFLREARAMSAVKHRNIVEITNFGHLPNGAEYMMMELIEGETLSEIIAREAPMSPLRALHICEEIAAGLAAAHAVGVVHRDLKPGNIVLMKQASEEPVVKVLDFGLARQLCAPGEVPSPEQIEMARADRASILAGTPEYISPEQASGKPVDGSGDLYAVGVILFEMLTGRLPFESTSAHELLQLHRSAIPPLLSSVRPEIYPGLELFVDRLLSKDPAKRADSAKVARGSMLMLAEEIKAIPPAAPIATPLVGPLVRQVRPPARPVRRKPRIPARAAGVVLLVAAASLLAVSITSSAASRTEGAAAAPQVAVNVEPLPSPAPPEAVEVEAVRPAPAVTREPARIAVRKQAVEGAVRAPPPPRKVHRKASGRAAVAPKQTCEVTETWRRRSHQQLELLEQKTIAAMPDTAAPAHVANVRNRTRVLAAAVSTATGSGCAQIDAQLNEWRARLQ